jgi:hypothetical protein
MQIPQVKVEFVGLLPTFFNLCAPCCTKDYVDACGIDYAAEQLKEYPPQTQEIHLRAYQLFVNLLRDFGTQVRPLAVGSVSPGGLWLTIKYRLGNDLNLVIGGRKVVKGDADDEVIKRAIEQEIHGSR